MKSKAHQLPLSQRQLPEAISPRKNRQKDLLLHEKALLAKGVRVIGGVDESGRGCLAGPVFAAVVVFPPDVVIPEVDDSKLLSAKVRDQLFDVICKSAIDWSVAMISAEEIDKINIHRASLKAMQMAVSKLKKSPEFLLVDGRYPIPQKVPQKAIVKGDRLSHTIAAASILAKVSRDRWMDEESKKYPGYSFKKHKGYGTTEHFDEIKKNGLTPLHRKSFTLAIT